MQHKASDLIESMHGIDPDEGRYDHEDSNCDEESWHYLYMWFSSPTGRFVIVALFMVAATTLLPSHKTVSAQSEKSRENSHSAQHSNSETDHYNNGTTGSANQSNSIIPFIVLEEPSWRDLSVMLEKYRQDASNLLKSVSQSLELALYSERELGIHSSTHTAAAAQKMFLFSDRLQHRLDRASTCLYHNEKVLLEMMKPFPVRFVLSHEANQDDDDMRRHSKASNLSTPPGDENSNTAHLFTMRQQFAGMTDRHGATKSHAYDCGGQVIAHIVRDWTVLGRGVRATIYDWCRQMVEKHVSHTFAIRSLPILVPGAGLGRLAHDLAFVSGHTVEANEIALSMSTAAHAILQQYRNGTLYPFALDSFANEVEAERRYDQVGFPDVEIQDHSQTNGTLSYTSGDFVQIYRWQRPPASFGCVVTCFFLDTATNLYEYISTIEHSLLRGGIWVNIGPLRWHHNSMLHPAADELRTIIESSFYSFEVLHWSVDDAPSNYRHEEEGEIGSNGQSFVRSTLYEGYKPLRFVVKRK